MSHWSVVIASPHSWQVPLSRCQIASLLRCRRPSVSCTLLALCRFTLPSRCHRRRIASTSSLASGAHLSSFGRSITSLTCNSTVSG